MRRLRLCYCTWSLCANVWEVTFKIQRREDGVFWRRAQRTGSVLYILTAYSTYTAAYIRTTVVVFSNQKSKSTNQHSNIELLPVGFDG